MTEIDLLGFAAGTLTTCAFWPQLQKTWVSKSAGDVSMGMLTIFSGCLVYLVYFVCLVNQMNQINQINKTNQFIG